MRERAHPSCGGGGEEAMRERAHPSCGGQGNERT